MNFLSYLFPNKTKVGDIMQNIIHGNINNVKRFIEDHPDKINDTDLDGTTYLMAAASQGSLELINSLINAGADFDKEDRLSHTALHYAVMKHQLEAVTILIKRGADTNCKDEDGNTPLHHAICSGEKCKDMVIALLQTPGKTKLKINEPDNSGRTPLHWACNSGHRDIVQFFLKQNGIDANATDGGGNTPLHLAVQNKRYDVVDLMLSQKSVHLDMKNGRQMTPLLDAVSRGHLGIMHSLIENGADTNVVDCEGNNCLHLSITRDKFHSEKEIMHILDKCCTELKMSKEKGLSGVVVARYLASHGANFYHKNDRNNTPFDLIKDLNSKERLQAFLLSRCRWCQEEKANIKFDPCQHIVICKDCYSEMTLKRCPMCRQCITNKIRFVTSKMEKKTSKMVTEINDSQKLEEMDLVKVARHISANWKEVGRFLGIPTPELEAINYDYAGNIKEQSYQMLYEWFTRCKPEECTVKTLRAALHAAHCTHALVDL